MKALLIMLLAALLTGCSAETVWERVTDSDLRTEAVWQAQAYTVQLAIPAQAELTERSDGVMLYSVDDGSCEISSHVFLASSADSAVYYLSGLRSSRLNVIETTRFGLPEYHFAWFAQTEAGGRIYQADLVMDGTHCYAVMTSAAEERAKDYDELFRQVFSGFGLSAPDAV